MSDVIVQRFEADSQDFVREVNKARESVKKMTGADLPLVRQELNAAFNQSQKVAQGMNQMGTASTRSGANMLIMAQVADDAQYGFRGLANQIPQLAMALGAGAGLAGAVSLVALALNYGIPLLKEFYGAGGDSEAAVKAAKKYGDAIEENLRKLRELNAAREQGDALADAEGKNNAGAARESTASQIVASYERQLALLEKQRKVEDEMRNARNGAAVAEAAAGGGDVAGVERSQLREAAAIAARRAQEDGKLLADLQRVSGSEGRRIGEAGAAWSASFVLNIAEARNELDRLERNAVFSKAAAEEAAAVFDAVKGKGYSSRVNETRNAKLTSESAAADEAAVAAQRAILESLKKQDAEQRSIFEASRKDLEIKAAAAAQRGRDVVVEAGAAREVAAARERELVASEAVARAAREKVAAEKRAAELKKAAEEAEKAAQLKKAQGEARGDAFGEVRALALQAAGREKEAQALRDQMRLRKEAVDLAERAGISEKAAAAVVMRKFELEKALANEKAKQEGMTRRNDGRIRLFKRGETAGGIFGNGAQAGLGGSVIEKNVRLAEQRAAAKANDGAGVTRTVEKLEDLYGVMKKQLAIWETGLGVK